MNKTKYVDCAGGIIINDNKEAVVVNQNHNSWSLPKGHVDDGETILEAAIREIYEETGIKNPQLVKPLGSFGRYRIGLDGLDDKSEYKTIYVFLFSSLKKTLKPIDKNNPIAKWVPYDEVPKLLTHKNDRNFFKKCISIIINEN
tara:strand:- start:1861 stop:2292 length:432 start_codon:yes stop_codon:yes gene_type:complete